jgi:hypothetical protein
MFRGGKEIKEYPWSDPAAPTGKHFKIKQRQYSSRLGIPTKTKDGVMGLGYSSRSGMDLPQWDKTDK